MASVDESKTSSGCSQLKDDASQDKTTIGNMVPNFRNWGYAHWFVAATSVFWVAHALWTVHVWWTDDDAGRKEGRVLQALYKTVCLAFILLPSAGAIYATIDDGMPRAATETKKSEAPNDVSLWHVAVHCGAEEEGSAEDSLSEKLLKGVSEAEWPKPVPCLLSFSGVKGSFSCCVMAIIVIMFFLSTGMGLGQVISLPEVFNNKGGNYTVQAKELSQKGMLYYCFSNGVIAGDTLLHTSFAMAVRNRAPPKGDATSGYLVLPSLLVAILVGFLYVIYTNGRSKALLPPLVVLVPEIVTLPVHAALAVMLSVQCNHWRKLITYALHAPVNVRMSKLLEVSKEVQGASFMWSAFVMGHMALNVVGALGLVEATLHPEGFKFTPTLLLSALPVMLIQLLIQTYFTSKFNSWVQKVASDTLDPELGFFLSKEKLLFKLGRVTLSKKLFQSLAISGFFFVLKSLYEGANK